ncbi:MAG TPA: xanthine dehydrogenase family protein molybdopterin-binding subunit [bacterium]|nr:xanthine dehydrogenase family protein molybdopterin-binding subunit [bacterium]
MPRIIRQKIEFEGSIEERDVVIEGDDLPVWQATETFTVVGTPVTRVDGAERVGGRAHFTADLYPPGLLHGAVLRSPHAHARLARFDASAAERAPGVRLVLSAVNAPKIPWYNGKSWLFDTELRYAGDEVAVVVADTPAQARDALDLIEVEYEALPYVIDIDSALRADAVQVHAEGNVLGGPERYERGDVELGFREADVTVELRADTPDVLHHSMETHGSVAHWNGESLTIWDSTQHIFGVRRQVAGALKIPLDHVRVVSPFMGGGFGSKNGAGKYTIVAAIASRQLGRPVRLMFTRAEESQAAGKRPQSSQRIRIGAKRDGTLTAIDYWGASNLGAYRSIGSPLAGPIKELYACPNVRTEVLNVFTHIAPCAAFRAPGFVEGTVALDCAMELLADKLGTDPLALRRRNYADTDQVLGRGYSSKFLREAYDLAAKAAGWERRSPTPSAPVAGHGKRRGFGMASQIWGGAGSPPAYAEIRLNVDGTAEVRIGTQEIGTGAKTALTQIAAEVLGLPVGRVTVSLGDTDLPYSPLSAGSQTITSCGPAVRMAADEVRRHLLDTAASLLEAAPNDIRLEAGRLFVAGVPERGMTVAEVTGRMGNFTLMGRGFRGPNPEGVTIRTFGVQIAEVEVDLDTGEVTVLRVVACHDVGRVINPLVYASQIEGGVIQGLGMALREEHVTDIDSGTVMDLGFDSYAVPRSSMIPEIVSLAVDKPDPIANNLGAKGVGEPPIIPTPAAIANAVANAIGARVTSLPITPAKVLKALGRLQ